MQYSIKQLTTIETQRTGCAIVTAFAAQAPGRTTRTLDKASSGNLSRLINAENFRGRCGETLLIHNLAGVTAERIIVLGLGKSAEFDLGRFRKALSKLFLTLARTGAKDAHFLIDNVPGIERCAMLQQIALAAGYSTYRYTRTLSEPAPPSSLRRLTVVTNARPSAADRRALSEAAAIANGTNIARELANLPANICTPSYLASQARALARKHKTVNTRILNEKQMRDLGMGSLLSVSAGSAEPARLIVMEYRGAGASVQPHVLVGKGVTFDSGGISLKPGPGMDEMKFDMGGAASVFGTINAIADIAPKLNVVGIVGAVENMPSGTATKPGDVVTSMAGITIEVLNTDAEGRLVLCDALTYAGRYKPRTVIDIATLTGACVIALGKHASGLYSNNDKLAQQLLAAGSEMFDRAWHMPLWPEYHESLKSNFADLANVGGREAGSVTAACFLSRFASKYQWAHLDVAGSAWDSGPAKGSTGRPVPLLTRYLLDRIGDSS